MANIFGPNRTEVMMAC